MNISGDYTGVTSPSSMEVDRTPAFEVPHTANNPTPGPINMPNHLSHHKSAQNINLKCTVPNCGRILKRSYNKVRLIKFFDTSDFELVQYISAELCHNFSLIPTKMCIHIVSIAEMPTVPRTYGRNRVAVRGHPRPSTVLPKVWQSSSFGRV